MKVKKLFTDIRLPLIISTIIFSIAVVAIVNYNNKKDEVFISDDGFLLKPIGINDYDYFDDRAVNGAEIKCLVTALVTESTMEPSTGSIYIKLNNGKEISVYDSIGKKYLDNTKDIDNVSPTAKFTTSVIDNSDGSKALIFNEYD